MAQLLSQGQFWYNRKAISVVYQYILSILCISAVLIIGAAFSNRIF